MKNEHQRANLAIHCAASYFNMFCDPTNRGPNWKKDKMPGMIKECIETQAFLNSIPEKHFSQMVIAGIEFYTRYLEPVLPE